MTDENSFHEAQTELIDISVKILAEWLKQYKKDPKYEKLFYEKAVPPHLLQPLQSLKNKIKFKPVFKKIENELQISHFKAKKLVETYWFSYILRNLWEIKKKMQ